MIRPNVIDLIVKLALREDVGTKDLTTWEQEFAECIEHRAVLTDKQLEVLEKIWAKHFAG